MCIIAIVLVLTTTVNTTQSKASVLLLCAGIGLTIEQVSVIATVIVASGVLLSSWEEIDRAVYAFWRSASRSTKEIFTKVDGLFDQAMEGVINVTQDAWDCFYTWLDNLFLCKEAQILNALQIMTPCPKPMDLPKFNLEMYRPKGMKYEYIFGDKVELSNGDTLYQYSVIFTKTKLYIARKEHFYTYHLHSTAITERYDFKCKTDGEVIKVDKYVIQSRDRIYQVGRLDDGVFEVSGNKRYMHGYGFDFAPSSEFGYSGENNFFTQEEYYDQLQEKLSTDGIAIPVPDDEKLPGITTGEILEDAGINTDTGTNTGTNTGDTTTEVDETVGDILDGFKSNSLDATGLYNDISSKFNYNIFEDTLKKLEKLKDAPTTPPKIYINLHKILDVTKHMGDFKNPLEDKETIFIDFSILEELKFQGVSVIQWFRRLVSIGMVITTFLHIKHVVMPQKAIKG